jgi:hypothetical protein
MRVCIYLGERDRETRETAMSFAVLIHNSSYPGGMNMSFPMPLSFVLCFSFVQLVFGAIGIFLLYSAATLDDQSYYRGC